MDEETPIEEQPAPCDCEKPKRTRKQVPQKDYEPSSDVAATEEAMTAQQSYQAPRHRRRCGCK